MIKAMARVILWFAILSFMGWYANSLSIRRIIKKVASCIIKSVDVEN